MIDEWLACCVCLEEEVVGLPGACRASTHRYSQAVSAFCVSCTPYMERGWVSKSDETCCWAGSRAYARTTRRTRSGRTGLAIPWCYPKREIGGSRTLLLVVSDMYGVG